jgi:hypothetical protein
MKNSEADVNMHPDDDRDLPTAPECGLEKAIDLLRDEVPVREEWRQRVSRELATQPTYSGRARVLRIRPALAIAAALAFMVVGGLVTSSWQRYSRADTALAAAASSSAQSEDAVGVRFAIMAPGAQRVSLVGDFNAWNPDVTPLKLAKDGRTWTTTLPLRSGRHTYAFVVDGEVTADPSAPRADDDDFGSPNSLVLVSASR